jgi:membrane-associated phospholipid phosphatase
LAMVTGMLTALWFLLGSVAFISFLLLPILGFSRYRLGEHTPLQIISGLCIGLIISSTVYYTFGLG